MQVTQNFSLIYFSFPDFFFLFRETIYFNTNIHLEVEQKQNEKRQKKYKILQ